MDTIQRSVELLQQGQAVAQGEIDLILCASIPAGAKRAEAENGLLILGHSETGHHHALALVEDVEVYDEDEFTSYVANRTAEIIELRHYKTGPDRHQSLGIPPHSTVKVIRGREYTPEGFRRVAD